MWPKVADVPTHGFFGAHAPVGPGEDPTARWGTSGLYEWSLRVHDAQQTRYALTTASPPDRWFELVVAAFPALSWELHTSANLIGRTVRAVDGRVVPELTEWDDHDHPPEDSDWAEGVVPLEEFLATADSGRPSAIAQDEVLVFGTAGQENERALRDFQLELIRSLTRAVPPEVLLHSLLDA